MKNFTPGKWMGVVAFIHVLASIAIGQLIVILNINIDMLSLYKLCSLSFGVFTIVWGAVFGSGAIKNIKKKAE